MIKLSQNITGSATWSEIQAQPDIWRSWAGALDIPSWRAWMDRLDIREVWFCGAGTSAYIGDILATGLPDRGRVRFRAVPSTDLVARPHCFLSGRTDTLIVNFGRSGSSAETLGTLEAVRALAPAVPMLNITCNPEGRLAKDTAGRALLLPEACHDAGFAMTSSFSTMLLTAAALFDESQNAKTVFSKLAEAAENAFPRLVEQVYRTTVPKRAVFVGSGSMAFAAREAALKVMELSAGQIPALWDTSLGFRHGPKSFVDDDTLIHVLLSSDPHARLYDLDLVEELREQFPNATTLTIGAKGVLELATVGSDLWDSVLSVLPAQIAAVMWSDALGLNIDDPFVGQSTLSRVVSNVRLHPLGGETT